MSEILCPVCKMMTAPDRMTGDGVCSACFADAMNAVADMRTALAAEIDAHAFMNPEVQYQQTSEDHYEKRVHIGHAEHDRREYSECVLRGGMIGCSRNDHTARRDQADSDGGHAALECPSPRRGLHAVPEPREDQHERGN